MNPFETNYWSLYFDFLKTFENIRYRRFPLPLYSHFYQLIASNKAISNKLKDPSIHHHFNNSFDSKVPIQVQFDNYLKRWNTTEKKRRKGRGSVVFYENLLNIPKEAYVNDFHHLNPVIVRGGHVKTEAHYPYNVYYLADYADQLETEIQSYKDKMNKQLQNEKNHPIFSNRAFQERVIQEIPLILSQISAAHHFMNNVKCDVMVLGETSYPESKALAFAAFERGIPVICLQHGIIALQFGYLPVIANYQAVFGPYEASWYKSHGVKEKVIKQIGSPKFDMIFTRKQPVNEKLKERLKINPKKKTLLFISHHEKFTELKTILSHLKNENVNIIVKPKGNIRALESALKQHKEVIISKHIHLYDLISVSDIVITYESTVALEAMLAKKPVFIWKSDSVSQTEYFQDVQPFFYNEPAQLSNYIVQFLNDPMFEKKFKTVNARFLNDRYPNPPNQSTNRLKKLIQSIKEKEN
mgnify:CR=1 FL=1